MSNELDLTYGAIAAELLEALELREEAARYLMDCRIEALGTRGSDAEGRHAEAQAAFESAELVVKEYLKAEVKKADSIVGLVQRKEALAELWRGKAREFTELARSAEDFVAWLKELTMSAMRELDVKKCEGARGILQRWGNGGLQPVDVRQPELLPARYQRFTLTLSGDMRAKMIRLFIDDVECDAITYVLQAAKPIEPDTDLIRNDLLKRETCPECNGLGASHNNSASVPCYRCHGEKTIPGSVSGAVLLPRGEHLRTS